MKSFWSLLIVSGLLVWARAAEQPDERRPHPITWDAMDKAVEAKSGDQAAGFFFKATNTSQQPVVIASVRPSCGCTVVDLPAMPWVLAPGASGVLSATVDFSGKDGTLAKSLIVESNGGPQTLTLRITLPPLDEEARRQNQMTARADRQAVFRGSCVECHVLPAEGKTGEDLFHAACLNCHTPTGRASMVPDLLVAHGHRDAVWWRTWIAEGRDGTLMPAFAKPRGPLTAEEIDSLVAFALSHLPTEAKTN